LTVALRIVLLLVLGSLVAIAAPAAEPEVFSGIVLTDMGGVEVPVDSLLERGPVVINFWATWCKPCRIEMPHLEEIYLELSPERVHFAAISLDQPRFRSRVETFVRAQQVKMPVYVDPDGRLARRFGVVAIPTTVVLDRSGTVVHRTRGYRRGDEIILKKKIEGLLKQSASGEADAVEEDH
jgi:thiol-disulfide isomerase/thioredoxin